MPYRAPVSDYRFIMDTVAGFQTVTGTTRFSDATDDMADFEGIVDVVTDGPGTSADHGADSTRKAHRAETRPWCCSRGQVGLGFC